MSRWHGYVAPLFVIAVSAFVTWCAWPPNRIAARPLATLVDDRAPTSHDRTAAAVHHAQAADVLLQKGKIEEAAVEYHRANLASPNHPHARIGLARVAAARGHYTRALELYRGLLDDAPTSEVAMEIGDILALAGDTRGAAEMYARAETLTRKSPAGPVPAPESGSRSRASAPFPEVHAGQ